MTMRGRTHRRPTVGFLDEVLEHLFGDVEVGDHAVLHRTHRLDVAGRAPEHFFGLITDRFDLVGQLVDHHHRRLAHHDAAVAGKNQCVGSAEIDLRGRRKSI